MTDAYTVESLKADLGNKLLLVTNDGTLLEQLDREVLGNAYVSLFRKTIDLLFQSCWQECRLKCCELLDITWEYLYTGHWKDVNITWRYAYSIVSYLKALTEFSIKKQSGNNDYREIIKTCDMGILMGAPTLENVLPKLASQLHRLHVQNCDVPSTTRTIEPALMSDIFQIETSYPLGMCDNKISVVTAPSIEYFQSHFMQTETPVIIRDCMDFWPAMSTRQWSLSYFKNIAGYRLVPVEVGSKYTEDSWSQKLMTVNDFINEYFEISQPHSNDVGYLAQHQLFDQIVELRNDIVIPSYCGLGDCDDVDVNAWFGPKGTVSPLHQDAKHNFLAQVVGKKYVRLYGIEHTSCLYPHSSHLLSNTSQVDVEKPDLEKFPLFSNAPYLECILSPGEMLYIPPMCWHFVRSLSVSFSVSFWWK